MMDGLLGRGAFYSRCKSLIKMTRTRIEAIRRKQNATQKFLKKDIADLLACGLETNAYGRIGGLVAELILSSCYDFIDRVCEIILKQLLVMQKHRECPEDCREAVASLMYAAARFSDLPELCDLRNIFEERYGNSLEYNLNKKLVENLSPKPPSAENKVQLMEDIASEFSIKWDARGFELRMSNSSASRQDQPKSQVRQHAAERRYIAPCAEEIVQKPERICGSAKKLNDLTYQNRGREDVLDNRHQMRIGREDIFKKEDGLKCRLYGLEVTSNRSKQSCGEKTFEERDEHDASSPRKRQLMADAFCSLTRKDSPESNHKVLYRRETGIRSTEGGHAEEINRIKDHNVPLLRRRELMIDEHEFLSHESTSRGMANTSKFYSADRLELSNGHTQDKLAGEKKVVEPKRNCQCVSPRRNTEPLSVKSEIEVLCAGSNHDDVASAKNSGNAVPGVGTYSSKSNFRSAIPPYVKPRRSRHKAQIDLKHPEADNGGYNGDTLTCLDGNRSEKLQTRCGIHNNEKHGIVQESTDSHDHCTDEYYRDYNICDLTPRRRSSKRRHLKSLSSADGNSHAEEDARVVQRMHSRRKGGESRKGLQILFDDDHGKRNNEEEKMIDRLLLHYCQKHPTIKPAAPRKNSTVEFIDTSMPSVNEARNGTSGVADSVPPPGRSISLPRERATPLEPKKVFSHASSFQPDMSTPAKHVHPKLPDYDDLAARFAALRRNKG
ncbi:hypothetical protein Dimus_003215 [Dionaea muscipula]